MNYDKDDPVTGYIAFERLLDRLLEEARESHVMRERQGDLHGALRDAEKKIEDLEKRCAGVAERLVEYQKGDLPIRELYEAAQNYLRAVSRALGRGDRPADVRSNFIAASARATKALEGAIPHVDLVPF